MTRFHSPHESHAHSLETLNMLYEYDDFMESIGYLADMGCGQHGLDALWWATRTTREETPRPLNIKCLGIDLQATDGVDSQHRNLGFRCHDFEQPLDIANPFDVVWCHDAFQYVLDPFATLRTWRDLMADQSMLALILPQTTNLEFNRQAFDQPDFCYHNWTMVSLIHVLAVSGFNCREGFFRKRANDPWLHAVVYRSEHEPMDPRATTWLDLAERDLLPDSVANSYRRHGVVRQRDLVLPWLDRALYNFADH